MTKPTAEDSYLVKRRDLKNNYYSLTFNSYGRAKHCRPGQFVHVQLPNSDIFFRRAFSVASVDHDKNEIELIIKIFGRGSRALSLLRKGDRINILGPLGQPFARPKKSERTIMIAGGVGLPPVMYFARHLIEHGFDPKRIDFFYGGASSGDIIERSRIKKMGVNFHPVTEDGSFGTKGRVTEPLEQFLKDNDGSSLRMFACGPEGLLKAVDVIGMNHRVPGQVSLEAPMPCGIGICLGCVVPLTAGGHARVCCEGPVFNIGEVKL